MNKEYFTDNISTETLAELIDETLRLEKTNKNQGLKSSLLKIIPAVAAIVLILSVINILPGILNNMQFTAGNNVNLNQYSYMSNKNIPEDIKITSIYAGSSGVYGAIDSDGKVYMWGGNLYGQCDVPDDLPPIKDLGIGTSCVIALDINGKLHGWGTSDYNDMGFIKSEGTFVDVDADGYHAAALSSEGKVYKWAWNGANEGGQESVPKDLPFIVSVQCSAYCTTAADADGNVYIWGITSGDLLSTKFDVSHYDTKAKMTASLAYNAIVLGEDGKIYGEVPHSWFNNKYKNQPDIKNIKAIYGGMSNAAAIDDNGKVYVWGEYYYNKDTSSIIDVPETLPPIVQVVLGLNSATALGEDGKIYEWGGQVYEGSALDSIYGAKSGSVDVYTLEELLEAVQNNVKDIYVKGEISIDAKKDFNISNGQTLHICQNAVLSVYAHNLGINNGGDLINDGQLIIFGRIRFDKEPTKIGDTSGSTGEIQYDSNKLTLSEVKYILDGNLPYNNISSLSRENYIFVIDEDYTLEQGKTIWLNAYTTLKVAKGVTLTVNGILETFNEPIIEGAVAGNIKVSKK